MESDRRTKRKSNFDVPPEALGLPNPALQNVLETIANIVPQWTPVTDAAFSQRIKRAMKNNFDYIIRCGLFFMNTSFFLNVIINVIIYISSERITKLQRSGLL